MATGTPFLAGQLVFAGCAAACQTDYSTAYYFNLATAVRRRRSLSMADTASVLVMPGPQASRDRRGGAVLQSVGTCTGTRALGTRETGDIDGNCIFNADDYTIGIAYLANLVTLNALQLSMFDQDRNGIYSSLDMILIAAVLLSDSCFMSDLRVYTQTADPSCAVYLEIDFEFLHNQPVASSGVLGLAVFLDIETRSGVFAALGAPSPLNQFQATCNECLLNATGFPTTTNNTGGSGAVRQFPKIPGGLGTVTNTGTGFVWIVFFVVLTCWIDLVGC